MTDAAAQVPMPLPSKSALTGVKPVWSFQPKTRRWSIKTKFLLALLALSLAPMILFVAMGYPGIVYVQERMGRGDLRRLAKDQAVIVSVKLDKISAATETAAFLVQSLLANPSAFGGAQSACTAEKPDNPDAACSYTLPPGISMSAAKPVVDLSGNLAKVFALVKESDPSLQAIFYATQSGVYLEYPWRNDTLAFTLEPAFAQDLNRGGPITEQVRGGFSENGVDLSQHTVVSTTDPGNEWLIRDDDRNRTFSVRRGKTGVGVYWEYDPRDAPWYLNAVGRDSVVWTKHVNWSGARFLFGLEPKIESQITDKVSPRLARAFADMQITLIENSPVAIEQGGKWRLRDKNGNRYEIRKENGKLRVYYADMLTASHAVLDPEGRLAGVVGLNIATFSIACRPDEALTSALGACPEENNRQLIYTPDPGYDFLLNERGELIDQETGDMFIPKAGGGIRSKMAAGNSGIEYAADGAAYVAYAPIRSISSSDGKSFWSAGVSMPEAQITRITDVTQQRLVFVLELAVGVIFAAMIIPVIFAAIRMSKGITEPIVELGAGVMRIGGGDLDYRLDVRTHDEIEELANAFNRMAGDLKSYIRDLKTTTAEKERFESELRVAHDIQMSFLKKIFPPFPHRSDFSLFAAIKTAREVGGDLYDFGLLDDDRLIFYVGDVSDKGVPASLIMAMTMTLMKRASAQPGITPAGILRQVNVTLSEDNENVMFVTLFIGILNLKTGELAFSNAGHNAPLILGAGGECRFLTLPEGLVLGVIPEAEYRDDTVRLDPGDMIVAYTDGVTEAMNPQRELYSERRLQETLTRLSGCPVEQTVAGIISSVKAHAAGAPQSDDIAVLAVKRN
jgi:serine phosphatase RsbU (regulator of sigma subunit)